MPELIGVVFVSAGLGLSLVVRDTAAHVALELSQHPAPKPTEKTGFWASFTRTSWRDRSLRGASQAGLVNNLNDGLTWGVFPLLFTEHGLGLAAVGLIKGLYPLLWGLGQIPTGHLADRIGRIPLIVTGMLVQAVAFVVALVLLEWPLLAGIASAVLLGIGPPWFHTTPQHHHRGPHRQTPEVVRRGADRLELTESDPDGGDGEHPLLFVAEVDVLERYPVATSRRPQLDRIARPLHNQPRRSGMPVRHVLGTRITRRP